MRGRSSPEFPSSRLDDGSGRADMTVLIAFLTFQFLGLLGISTVLVTALCSKRIYRFSTWISFCVSWIISCLSYTLLTFAGQQTGPPPGAVLCNTQSAMVYGAPVLTAFTTLALVIQLRDNLCNLLTQETVTRVQWKSLCLLIIPYVVYAATLAEALWIGVSNPDTVERLPSGLYCHVSTGLPGKISGVISAVVVTIALGVQVNIGLKLYRNWYALKGVDARAQRSIKVTIRAMLFTLGCSIVVGVAVSFTVQNNTPIPNLFIAFLPFAAFLVFGLQSDIIRVWMFWRPAAPPVMEYQKGQYVDLA